jgi:hypothetical protein
VVGQRRQHETGAADHGGPQSPPGPGRELVDRDAADQMGGDGRGVGLVEEGAHRAGQVSTEVGLGDHAVEQPAPGVVVLDRLGQQLAHIQHLDAPLPQRVGERIVLLAGPLDPEHVVEQQAGAVGRRQPPELEVGPVQQHPPQDPDLGIDMEGVGGWHRWSFHCRRRGPARGEGGRGPRLGCHAVRRIGSSPSDGGATTSLVVVSAARVPRHFMNT